MTTATARKPKQTAGNNADLARIRKAMNTPIFRRASEVYNADGRDAAKAYLGQFFNEGARPRCIAGLFGE
jgi:hypothetical protein